MNDRTLKRAEGVLAHAKINLLLEPNEGCKDIRKMVYNVNSKSKNFSKKGKKDPKIKRVKTCYTCMEGFFPNFQVFSRFLLVFSPRKLELPVKPIS